MTSTPAMSAPPIDESELDRMLSALVDGLLSGEDRERLEARLLDDDAARRRYLEFMQVEFLLASEIGYGDLGGVPPAADGPKASVARRRSPSRWAWFRGGAAAAVLVGLAIGGAVGPRWTGGSAAPPAARITALREAVWEDDREQAVGRPVVGPMRLLEGSAQITFASGAVVVVHAPAALEVLGDNRMFLRSGRATPFVPPSAKGFTVVSPGGEVVDFGTEFSVGVAADGDTDVLVINGEVAVAGGHGEGAKPLHLTQGFATRFAAREENPEVTLRPLVVDHFDAQDGPLRRRDCDPARKSMVGEGRMGLPIDGRPDRAESTVHTVLANDFSGLVGRRSAISFKAWLPSSATLHAGRWVALVLDGGTGDDPPRAADPDANLAIMMSPSWRVGMRAGGQVVHGLPSEAFERSDDGLGPYQVVLTIDDSPAARARHGSAVVTAMVNGLEFIRDYPFSLPEAPRLSLHTYVRPREGGRGFALIDDFSVSVEAGAE